MGLLDHVADFLQRNDLARCQGIVAISGGPDSVALAHACVALVRQQRLAAVVLAHLNHQLRGSDSDADEAFVKNLPVAWNAPALRVAMHRIDVSDLANANGDNLENAARTSRYSWLTDVARQTGATWVATGHSADDQAETVLHHVLRGSGLTGLAGMAERRALAPGIDLVRPLLAIRRTDILAYLHEHRLEHCHDASNDDRGFTRNRLRHELIPRLERDFNPALVEVLGRTALQLREIQDELTQQAAEWLTKLERPRAGNTVVLSRGPLEAMAPVLVRELLRLIWQREDWPTGAMGFSDWERAAALARGEPRGQDFPGGVQVRAVGQVIQLCRQEFI